MTTNRVGAAELVTLEQLANPGAASSNGFVITSMPTSRWPFLDRGIFSKTGDEEGL